MLLAEKSEGWERQGLLDGAREHFCTVLTDQCLTRSHLEQCFSTNLPKFAVVASMDRDVHENDLTAEELSAFIIDYCDAQRLQCIELCYATMQNMQRPGKTLREIFQVTKNTI